MAAESDLRPGVIVQAEEQMYRVLTAEYRAGGGKMPGAGYARLQDVVSGSVTDRRFRPEEKLMSLTLERETMEFPIRTAMPSTS